MSIVFSKKILDNVHGFIPYTDEEGKIINLPLFRRLQGIKQLSLIDRVFPGAEHTRFIHSLGVMHIADKMAIQLGYENDDRTRKIVRFAGLLHDIGHYPLSHVCEKAYRDYQVKDETISLPDIANVKKQIDGIDKPIKTEFMTPSKGAHHEAVSADIVRKSGAIRDIIINSCGEDAIEQICAMITGDGESDDIDKVLVQILHSEIDADGIDYMLRDALFSGTSFGSFEIDMLINHMAVKEVDGEKIVYIRRKGIPAADQYLINKYFSYSQVTFNKRVAIYEWMATNIVAWMQQANAYFPKDDVLLGEWVKEGKISDSYLRFDDNFFWKALRDMVENPLACFSQKEIVCFCQLLLSHKGLEMVDNSEIRFESDDLTKAKYRLQEEEFYKKNAEKPSNKVTLFTSVGFTKHVPIDVFDKALEEEAAKILESDKDDPEYNEEESREALVLKQQRQRIRRLMDGVAVEKNDGTIALLCDDDGSLMHYLYKIKLYMKRTEPRSSMPKRSSSARTPTRT